MLFLICLMYLWTNGLSAEVIDHLVACKEAEVETPSGLLLVSRETSQEIDPWKDSVTAPTTVTVLEQNNPKLVNYSFNYDAPFVESLYTSIYDVSVDYLVSLTTSQTVVLSAVDYGKTSTFQVDVNRPAYLFVFDFNQDHKKDILVGAIQNNTFTYQIAYNTTSYPTSTPQDYIVPTFKLSELHSLSWSFPYKGSVTFTDATFAIYNDEISALCLSANNVLVLFEWSEGSFSFQKADIPVNPTLSTKVEPFNINGEYSEPFKTAYVMHIQAGGVVLLESFTDTVLCHFEGIEDYIQEGYQVTDFFLPSTVVNGELAVFATGQMGIWLSQPNSEKGIFVVVGLLGMTNDFDSLIPLHMQWEEVGKVELTSKPRLAELSPSKRWFVVTGESKITII